MGGELVRAWSLPDSLYEAVRYQNSPESADKYPLEVAIAHVSARCVQAWSSDDSADPQQWNIKPAAIQLSGLTMDGIAQAANEAGESTRATLDMLIGREAA